MCIYYVYIYILLSLYVFLFLLLLVLLSLYTFGMHICKLYVSVLYTWKYETLSLRVFLVWMVLEEQLHWQIKWKSLGSYQTLEYHPFSAINNSQTFQIPCPLCMCGWLWVQVKICQDNNMFHKQNKCQPFHSGGFLMTAAVVPKWLRG